MAQKFISVPTREPLVKRPEYQSCCDLPNALNFSFLGLSSVSLIQGGFLLQLRGRAHDWVVRWHCERTSRTLSGRARRVANKLHTRID